HLFELHNVAMVKSKQTCKKSTGGTARRITLPVAASTAAFLCQMSSMSESRLSTMNAHEVEGDTSHLSVSLAMLAQNVTGAAPYLPYFGFYRQGKPLFSSFLPIRATLEVLRSYSKGIGSEGLRPQLVRGYVRSIAKSISKRISKNSGSKDNQITRVQEYRKELTIDNGLVQWIWIGSEIRMSGTLPGNMVYDRRSHSNPSSLRPPTLMLHLVLVDHDVTGSCFKLTADFLQALLPQPRFGISYVSVRRRQCFKDQPVPVGGKYHCPITHELKLGSRLSSPSLTTLITSMGILFVGYEGKKKHHTLRHALTLGHRVSSLAITKFSWTHILTFALGVSTCHFSVHSVGWTNAWHTVIMHKDYIFECKNDNCRKKYAFLNLLIPGILLPGKRPGACWISVVLEAPAAALLPLYQSTCNFYLTQLQCLPTGLIAFKPILDLHSEAILAADPNLPKPAQDEQEEAIVLPTSLKKVTKLLTAIKQYYAKCLTDKEEAEDHEASSHPREPSFYKKTLSEWDVAQKLFKQEIDAYDKAKQQSNSLEYSIKYRTGHAREWFNNMTSSQQQEVNFAMKKWNEEGAPEETQAIYRKNNLKKTLEDFAEQIRRTMGCRIVMLVSHKKKGHQSLSVSLSGPQMDLNPPLQTGHKTEFYPLEDSQTMQLLDCGMDLSLTLTRTRDEGWVGKTSCFAMSIGLKGQHELIRSIFHTSYKVCTGGSRPVPWGMITASPTDYLEPGSIPTGFAVKDPSHMKTDEVNHLWRHWEQHSAANQKLVVFIKAKDADMHLTGKSKKKVVRTQDLDEEDQGRPVPIPSERRTQPATHSHETTPDDVAINDRYTFLETLSKNENYLELVDAIRDLAILANQTPISEQHEDLPTWADWSWRETYLPEDIHTSYAALVASLNMLQTCPISGSPSVMPVVLVIGLLYRESKRVIEYEEDEADPNTPSYLPHSIFDLQFLVALDNAVREVLFPIVGHIERLMKEGLDNEEEMRMVVDNEEAVKSVAEEEGEEQEQEVDAVVQKGRKREGAHHASSINLVKELHMLV
ncbi:hypothetical protein DFH29DRAFT_883403, partial [Suillus ampliporus]